MLVGEIACGDGYTCSLGGGGQGHQMRLNRNNQGSRKEHGRIGFLMLSRESILRRRPGFICPTLLLLEGGG